MRLVDETTPNECGARTSNGIFADRPQKGSSNWTKPLEQGAGGKRRLEAIGCKENLHDVILSLRAAGGIPQP